VAAANRQSGKIGSCSIPASDTAVGIERKCNELLSSVEGPRLGIMKYTSGRTIALLIVAFVGMPMVTTSACASSDESSAFEAKPDAANDSKVNEAATGGSGGTGGTGGTSIGGGGTSTGGGGTGGGTCNTSTCPSPAPPATKCCVGPNGPCGVDYGQGAGCQSAPTSDI
jgi:Glycine rich protein family